MQVFENTFNPKPMRDSLTFLMAFGLFLGLNALPKTPISTSKTRLELAEPTINYDAWDSILSKYVANGRVNYKGLKSDKPALENWLKTLTENPPKDHWSRAEKMAFWINAYNSFTIKLIVDNYPIKKITDLDGGKTWDVKRLEIGGKKYSLNQIENEILRPQFNDARIHFAINCAAKSCPPILNRAFRPAMLNDQLEKQTRRFVRNQNFNQIASESATVSKIFDWYGVDFGDLKKFLNKYAKTKMNETATIQFSEYDWGLNE